MKKFLINYGMILVLIALCALFSLLTIKRESATETNAAGYLVAEVVAKYQPGDLIFVAGSTKKKDSEKFIGIVANSLREKAFTHVEEVVGAPRDLRQAWDTARELLFQTRRAVTAHRSGLEGVQGEEGEKAPDFGGTDGRFPMSSRR